MNLLKLAALALSALAAPAPALAADPYPTKPVRIVVNSSPGGLTDVVARLISIRMSQEAGQAVVVENRSSAVVGIDTVAKAPADGYTVGVFASALSSLPALVSSLPFNPQTSLTPVALVTSAPLVLVTSNRSQYQSVRDYVTDARSNPGKVSIASGGSGTLGHLLSEQFQTVTGTQLIHVPYKGGAPAMADVMAGHVPVFFDAIATTTPLARDGKIRPLAIVSDKRSPALPDVPTMAEAGFPGVEGQAWFGMFAPAGTPPDVVAKINTWVNRALQSPEVRERLTGLGAIPEGGTPMVMGDLLGKEIPRWGKLVRERNIPTN
ncbi:MAG: tripartite tricarboxylate transporter substrate binding protein [Pseudomonadota bacterium]